MIHVVWKRNHDGLLEAFTVHKGKRNPIFQWIGVVDGNMWTLADTEFRSHRAASESAAMTDLVEAFQKGVPV